MSQSPSLGKLLCHVDVSGADDDRMFAHVPKVVADHIDCDDDDNVSDDDSKDEADGFDEFDA